MWCCAVLCSVVWCRMCVFVCVCVECACVCECVYCRALESPPPPLSAHVDVVYEMHAILPSFLPACLPAHPQRDGLNTVV